MIFLDALLEVQNTAMRPLIENMKPEVIIHHDDWGNKTQPVCKP